MYTGFSIGRRRKTHMQRCGILSEMMGGDHHNDALMTTQLQLAQDCAFLSSKTTIKQIYRID